MVNINTNVVKSRIRNLHLCCFHVVFIFFDILPFPYVIHNENPKFCSQSIFILCSFNPFHTKNKQIPKKGIKINKFTNWSNDLILQKEKRNQINRAHFHKKTTISTYYKVHTTIEVSLYLLLLFENYKHTHRNPIFLSQLNRRN